MIFLKGRGIVISKNEIGEADRYISVFMEDFGKVSVLIKGIRKSKKRDKVAVDLISLTDFTFYKKGDRIIISDFVNIENYEKIRKDLSKLNLACYFFSLLNKILVESEKNRKIYNMLEKILEYLNRVEDKIKIGLLTVYFLYEIIKDEGILPETDDIINFFEDQGLKDVINLPEKAKIMLKEISGGNFRKIIANQDYKFADIKEIIFILEKYLNLNLEIDLNIKKFLWGDLLW